VIYIILGVLYESYVHPLMILSTLPSAGLGALVTLMAFGFDFSLIALIGIILLIGIVKKNGIMLVDFAIEAQRNRGLSPVDAIREACLLRFRPIMMTTMAALLGGVPLMLGTGTGAEIRQPRLCDRRRPDRQPGADALYDADCLPLPRPSQYQVRRRCSSKGGPDGGRIARFANPPGCHPELGGLTVAGPDGSSARKPKRLRLNLLIEGPCAS
jgi:hypothetical protein